MGTGTIKWIGASNMKKLAITILALLPFVGVCHANNNDKHPQQNIKQFMDQCLNAGNNMAMCRCSVRAFRNTVHPDEVDIRHHGSVNINVLRIEDSTALQLLADEIEFCEVKHPSH